MKEEKMFEMLLGIKAPWYVKRVRFDPEIDALLISVDFQRGAEFQHPCQDDGEEVLCKAYDTTIKKYRHVDIFQYKCFIEARVPRVSQAGLPIRLVRVPWQGHSYGFTLLFESFIVQLAKHLPVHKIARMMKTYDSKIWKILHFYADEARKAEDFSDVKEIGMDETSARKGHNYVSIFVDMEKRKTLYVAEGKGSETVKEFAVDLKKHCKNGASSIEKVSCDMSSSFIKGVKENFPDAEIVFDKFHLMALLNRAVDAVRRRELKKNPILIGSKYVCLKNRENYTPRQEEKYREIELKKMNLETFRAMRLREAFRQIYFYGKDFDRFKRFLNDWNTWATHCQIPEIVKVAKTFRRYWYGIITWAKKILPMLYLRHSILSSKLLSLKRVDIVPLKPSKLLSIC